MSIIIASFLVTVIPNLFVSAVWDHVVQGMIQHGNHWVNTNGPDYVVDVPTRKEEDPALSKCVVKNARRVPVPQQAPANGITAHVFRFTFHEEVMNGSYNDLIIDVIHPVSNQLHRFTLDYMKWSKATPANPNVHINLDTTPPKARYTHRIPNHGNPITEIIVGKTLPIEDQMQ